MTDISSNDDLQKLTNTIYFVIAESLQIDMQQIRPESRLLQDLAMTPQQQQELSEFIMHLFNDYQLNFSTIDSVQDLVDQVLTVLRGLPDFPAPSSTNSLA